MAEGELQEFYQRNGKQTGDAKSPSIQQVDTAKSSALTWLATRTFIRGITNAVSQITLRKLGTRRVPLLFSSTSSTSLFSCSLPSKHPPRPNFRSNHQLGPNPTAGRSRSRTPSQFRCGLRLLRFLRLLCSLGHYPHPALSIRRSHTSPMRKF
jgi:hypothetical protein